MASHRPSIYAQLVLAVYRGHIITHDGKPWGSAPDLNPILMAQDPALSVREQSHTRSHADWMVAVSMISELKEQDFVRKEVLGHAEYLGQDAVSPDGKTSVDLARGTLAHLILACAARPGHSSP